MIREKYRQRAAMRMATRRRVVCGCHDGCSIEVALVAGDAVPVHLFKVQPSSSMYRPKQDFCFHVLEGHAHRVQPDQLVVHAVTLLQLLLLLVWAVSRTVLYCECWLW